MKRVIISGASGFIGNAVARYMMNHGITVIAIVKPGAAESNEAFRLRDFNAPVIECDLKDIKKLPDLLDEWGIGYDAFYQFAWDGVDREGMADYKRQMENIEWTLDSVKAAMELKCKKFIGTGSVTQMELFYPKGRFFTADRHKYFRSALLASETMGRALAAEYDLEFIWPIIINVYGEGETSSRLINNMIKNLMEGKHQPLSEGKQLYDFLHIEDAARAFYLIGEKGCANKDYIIGSGNPRPLVEYLKCIRDIVAPGVQLGIGELEFNGLEMTKEMLNTNSLVEDTGFIPEVDFETGIKRTFSWIKKEVQ